MTDEGPYATVEQVGRWTYRVTVRNGILAWGPDGYGWRVFGRSRARRKAAKVLRRYLAAQEWKANVERVSPDGMIRSVPNGTQATS